MSYFELETCSLNLFSFITIIEIAMISKRQLKLKIKFRSWLFHQAIKKQIIYR
jgi:hypothetical protein